jgi:hypothetical protein
VSTRSARTATSICASDSHSKDWPALESGPVISTRGTSSVLQLLACQPQARKLESRYSLRRAGSGFYRCKPPLTRCTSPSPPPLTRHRNDGEMDGSRTTVVNSDAPARGTFMTRGRRRLSVSLDEETHRRVLELASKNEVSAAWIIRYAVAHLLEEQQGDRDRQLVLPLEEFRTSIR